MSMAMMLKVFSDCCICFAILASGPVSFSAPLLIPGAVFGAIAGVATFFEEKGFVGLRRCCAVLPFACLLLGEGTGQVLVLAVPAVYTAALILGNKLELEYYAFRRFFLQSLGLLGGVYLAVNVWIFLTQITSDVLPSLDPNVILRYSLVHLLCGIVLQRQLRLGVDDRAAGGNGQMVGVLGTVGAMIAGFALAEPLLRQGIRRVMQAIVGILFTPLLLIVDLLAGLVEWFGKRGTEKEDYEAFLKYLQTIGLSDGFGSGAETTPPVQEELNFTELWVTFAVILLVIVAVLVVRSFRKRLATADPGGTSGRVITTPKKKRVSRLSNRGKVRQIYRDFLRREKDLGLKLRICDTSADVNRRLHAKTDKNCAEQLRQVYLAARYDDRREITQNLLEKARTAYKNAGQAKK